MLCLIVVVYEGWAATPVWPDPVEPTLRIERLRTEGGFLVDDAQSVDTSNYGYALASATQRVGERFDLRLAGRVDAYWQTGTPDYADVDLDYADSFVRFRDDRFRVTAGAQTVAWGRTDEISPADRISVSDLTRGVLDELADRRRAVPALRFEGFEGSTKLDMLWIPWFRPAELPDQRSIWSPADTTNGRLFGLPESPALRSLLPIASFDEDVSGSGGIGTRLSLTGDRLDFALSLQRTRHSEPYYALNPEVREVLLATGDPETAVNSTSAATFKELHPWTWVASADAALDYADGTWRAECAYLSDTPVTTTDFRVASVAAVDCVVGVEFYPGDANVRSVVQLASHNLIDSPDILELTKLYTLNGQLSADLFHGRWAALFRFDVGLNKYNLVLNLQLSYRGWEPHEFYVGALALDGNERTVGGFFDGNDMIILGWRAKF